MSLLFETISIRNGMAENLPWHQERFEFSYHAFFGRMPDFTLFEVLHVPVNARQGHFRCRIDYDKVVKKISFNPYFEREVNKLRMVTDNSIDYRHKLANRSQLDVLFELRNDCDDVLIVKNGLISDTSVANIILWDGRRWLTPAVPLLPGTCRTRLLDYGLIHEAKIKPSDLHLFKEVKLINAMRDMDETKALPVGNIV